MKRRVVQTDSFSRPSEFQTAKDEDSVQGQMEKEAA